MARLMIAIDGPAAAGKGTLARRLAAHLGLPYLDTGLLYRAVGRHVLDEGRDPSDPEAAARAALRLTPDDLARDDLRTAAADRAASAVAGQERVRGALLAFQRDFAARAGAVLDGRDIGTVVLPEAPVKLFVTASLAARAARRWRERGAVPGGLPRVTAELAARDAEDAARTIAPLRPAPDAVTLDTTELDPEAAFAAALAIVAAKWPGAGAWVVKKPGSGLV